MGLSSNQARFLSLTSRQVDLERRIQQICQRRLRLASELENVATSYNDKISDRKLYINTLRPGSSGPTSVGATTHNNLYDNPRYEAITIDNLYDNGYHVFVDDQLYDMMRTATGATTTAVRTSAPYYNTGDWFDNTPPQFWRVTGSSINAPTIVAPTAAEAGSVSGSSTTAAVAGTPNTTPVYSAWSAGALVQNPTTGQTSQTFTRTGSVENNAGTTGGGTGEVTVTVTQATSLGSVNGTTNIGGVNFNQYTYTNYRGDSITTLAIGDVDNAQAVAQLNALAAVGDISAGQNFILMRDVDMSSVANWGIIDTVNGTFDGNMHTINNLTIAPAAADARNVGMFGLITTSGTVKNLNIANEIITANSTVKSTLDVGDRNYIGGISGGSDGILTNCHVTGLNMTINGSAYFVGGVSGDSGNSMDTSIFSNNSAQGTITITSATAARHAGVGGLAGCTSGGNVEFSYSDVAINVTGPAGTIVSHTGVMAGDVDAGGESNTKNIRYCYSSGTVTVNGSLINGSIGQAGDFAYGLAHPACVDGRPIISTSYCGTPGAGVTPPTTLCVYDSSPSPGPDAVAWNDIKDATVTIGGTPINVWNPNGTLNQAAVNTETRTVSLPVVQMKTTTNWTETITRTDNPGITYQLAEYVNSAFDPSTLEERLRDGSVKIAKHADEFTQEVITVAGVDEKFE